MHNRIETHIKPHWHCAYERLHSRCRLVIAGSETSTHVLVIEDLLEVEQGIRLLAHIFEGLWF